MKHGQLRDYFTGVGVKRLSAVDAEPHRSNQHEVGTTRPMRDRFLGASHQEFTVQYLWLGDEQDNLSVEGTATHYDARASQPHRSPEWRLYYPANAVTEAMREGDTLFLAMRSNGSLCFIVALQGSTAERQLLWLFGVNPHGRSFVSRDVPDDGPELDFATRFILDEIGVEVGPEETDSLDAIIEPLGTTFPRTAEFSELARRTLPEIDPRDDPDNALLMWLDQEEALFRRLERRVVAARLEAGFADENGTDVDGFIRFSLSVQNRRKSRMGYSLENHLEAVFEICGVTYDRGAVTEHGHRPDFLFPGVEAYRAAREPGSAHLVMLGAKSSCKERWRQVLAEADMIPEKHLLTLEPGISESQTDQMSASMLQLVVPRSIQETYSVQQRAWLWSVDSFIQFVARRTG